jgi:two-component system, chemotaxis family, CheB/CheR fusion protein
MSTEERDPDFEALLQYIRDQRGFDFTGYKRPSLMRRISKRMQDVKIESFASYHTYLDANPTEYAHLFDTILINVTSFFRDKPSWDYIASDVVPRILADKDGKDPVRIWSTGCSTGEEAYTIAMVFADAMGDDDFKQRVKIYATDIDDDALSLGRHAVYTESQLEPVPEAFRPRFFEQTNGGTYAFRADLRRSVIFGRHDLVQDPPISRIDLLVSRNTLMYFDVATQQRILVNFHFALREHGVLFLGKSEVLVARSPLYAAVDLRRRVFSKVPTAPARERIAPQVPQLENGDEDDAAAESVVRDAGFEASPLAQILIDRSGRVAAANMQARTLFGLSQRDVGSLLQDLELSYRPVELRSRIEQAYTERHTVSLRDVEWHAGTEVRYVDVQLHPLSSQTGDLLGVAVTFNDVTRYRRLQEALQESKREVETAYEELQSTVEELETTNEELQSTNEELETTNEELQSTNEELETMNEELQSTNEELETINDELQQRTDELNDVNSFLEAVLSSLTAAVVVLDRELRIQAWNEAARDLWGLRSDEVLMEHILNLDIGLPVDQLRKPVRAALAGDPVDEITLDAVNRRGRQIRVRLRFAPLANDGMGVRGAIVMMEVAPDPEAQAA